MPPLIKIRLVIFAGLLFSGSLLAVGYSTAHTSWLRPGVILGWFFGTASAVDYLFTLALTLYRRSTPLFWQSWSPLNFGLTLLGVGSFMSRFEFSFLCVYLFLFGLAIAFLIAYLRISRSITALTVLHVCPLLSAIPPFSTIWEAFLIPFASSLVGLSLFDSVCRRTQDLAHDADARIMSRR